MLERFLADARDIHQLFDRCEVPMGFAIVDDALCHLLPDAIEEAQLLDLRRVDVDRSLELGLPARRSAEKH